MRTVTVRGASTSKPPSGPALDARRREDFAQNRERERPGEQPSGL